jgi:hypothetical protein
MQKRRRAEKDVACRRVRLAGDCLRKIVAGDALMYLVGHHVFVVELGCIGPETEPAEPIAVPLIRAGRRHFESSEMSGKRAAKSAMQSEEMHQVDRRQRYPGSKSTYAPS